MEKSESEFQSGKEKRIFCEELESAVWHVCSIVSESETLWTIAHQASLYMGFPWQAHWSGLSFPSPGGLPDPGIKPRSPALTGGFFTTELPGKPPANYPAYKKLTTPLSGASCLLRWPTLRGLRFSQGPSCSLRRIAFCLWNVYLSKCTYHFVSH